MRMRNAQYDRGYADAKEGLAPREPGKLYFEGYYAAKAEMKGAKDD
jgi:hypothetical protein